MAINFFIPDIGKTGPPDYEYAISFHQKCFVLELFHRKYSEYSDMRLNNLVPRVFLVVARAEEDPGKIR
jgi:hypothetical protein